MVATKATGPSAQMTWIRGGPPALDGQAIRAALQGSLARLGTDYIDLYQLHWPDRCCAIHSMHASLACVCTHCATLLPCCATCMAGNTPEAVLL